MKKYIILIVAIIVIIVGVALWYRQPTQPEIKLVASVSYLCRDGKNIEATYYKGTPISSKPGEPPIPNGSVSIKLSDGRSLTLPQTISASGIRYANPDESFVFWSKGNGAFVLEHNTDQTYIGCVVLAKDPGDLPNAYVDQSGSFSIRYPADYSINASYQYQELGPGKEIDGVKFTIPPEMATGTNLSSYDTGVSVEIIPAVQNCNANLFIYQNTDAQTATDNGVEYSVASTTGAAAGNRYEERVWAIPGTNPCIAIRYLIHYGNIQNYPAGAVREFDQNALLKQFDEMRRSLMLVP